MAQHGQRGKTRRSGHKMGRHTGTGHQTLNQMPVRSGHKNSHLNPKGRSAGSSTSGTKRSSSRGRRR